MFFSFVSVAWGVHIFAASTCDVRFSTSEEVSSGPFVTPRALSHVFSALFHLDGVLSEMARCQAGLKGPGGFCKQFRASLIAATRLKNTARKRPQRQPAATSSNQQPLLCRYQLQIRVACSSAPCVCTSRHVKLRDSVRRFTALRGCVFATSLSCVPSMEVRPHLDYTTYR